MYIAGRVAFHPRVYLPRVLAGIGGATAGKLDNLGWIMQETYKVLC
jgi:hypothetical protein